MSGSPPGRREVRLFYFTVVAAWVLGAELVLIGSLNGKLGRWGQASGSLLLVLTAGLLIVTAALDLRNRRDAARMLRRHSETLSLVADLARSSMAELPIDELLDELAGRLRSVLAVDQATILVAADEGGLAVRASRGDAPLGGPSSPTVQQEFTSRVATGPETLTSEHLGPTTASGAAAPIAFAGRTLGVCAIGTAARRSFTEHELDLLRAVADRVAIGLEQARVSEAERKSSLAADHARSHLTLLARSVETLNTALEDYEPPLAALVDVIVPAFGDWCAVDVVDPRGRLRRLATRTRDDRGGMRPDDLAACLPEWDAISGRVAAGGPGELHWQAPTKWQDPRLAPSPQSWLVVPVRTRGVTVGLISCATGFARRGYRASDLALAEDLAERASVMVERVLLYRDLRHTALASERLAARLRLLIEATPAAIIEVDLVGQVRMWNRSATSMFSWPDNDHAGVAAPTFPSDISDAIEAIWTRAAQSRHRVTSDLTMVTTLGATRDLTVSAAPLPSPDGEVDTVLVLALDVTEQKQLAEAMRVAQQMEAIGQVAGGVAHDFNNLLTVIGGYSDLLLHRFDLAPTVRDMVEGISGAASRAGDLTRQLLTVSRRQPANPVTVSPNEALRTLAPVLERVLGVDITLRWQLDSDAGNVCIDPSQLEQVVINLAVNARDAMPGGGTLAISTSWVHVGRDEAPRHGIAAGDYVQVAFEDSGIGMDEATRQRCFEPFFTTKDRAKGTGLGLAAVYGIVSESGGAISVTSGPGQGTRFDIHLPRIDAAASRGRQPSPAADRGSGETVLVVEDKADVRTLVAQVLERAGYRVLTAANGAEALTLAGRWEGSIELVVCDVVMPDMRGPQVVDALMRERPTLTGLLMSGYTDGTVLPAVNAEAVAFLAKPFTPSELTAKVRELLPASDPRARSGSRPLAPS